MKCPFCQHDETKVVDSRESDEATRRRRECLKCQKRFTTYERVDLAEMMVVKKDGSRELFDRQKIKIGIQKACHKRHISDDKIEKVVDAIEAELRAMEKAEIPSDLIGKKIMQKLKRVDNVAYIRFASVYRQFADISSFEAALKALKKGKE
ncbi:MAG: transcriptional regulator NrdR [Nanoarchaeota archaeon]